VNESLRNRVPILNIHTPIPDKFMNNITKRARNTLIREKILSCEQMLECDENVLCNIGGVGIKTVREIINLKKKIAEISINIVEHHKGSQVKDTTGNDSLTLTQLKPSYPILKNSCLPDSLDSSLLSRTLPEIFQTVSQQYDYSNDEPQNSISSLGIPQQDINRLRVIGLFPDDPADVLFHFTVGYLLQSEISEETFSCILDHLSSTSGFTNRDQMTISVGALSDDPIFSESNSIEMDLS
jgi:hypothetical protein